MYLNYAIDNDIDHQTSIYMYALIASNNRWQPTR